MKLFYVFLFFLLLSGCQTIEKKSQAAIKKEKQENMIEFFENLEDNEDVQNFFNNANFMNN